MIPWKGRLYAFLIRRILGPWLDESSLELLHNSIEISLQEGKLILKNIGLNTQQITRKLFKDYPYQLTKATVERLHVSLSLEEVRIAVHESDNHDDSCGDDKTGNYREKQQQQQEQEQQQGSFTLAWRVMTDDSSSSKGTKIALMAKVLLEGIVLHVEPALEDHDDDNDNQCDDNDDTHMNDETKKEVEIESTKETSSTFSSYLSSYVDAALASLRLSVNINQLTIRLNCPPLSTTTISQQQQQQQQQFRRSKSSEQRTAPWLELRVQMISYHDVDTNKNKINHKTTYTSRDSSSSSIRTSSKQKLATSSYCTVLHKSLDMTKISISVGGYDVIPLEEEGNNNNGDISSSHSTMIVFLDGTTQIRMRAIQYDKKTLPSSSSSSPTQQQQQQQQYNHSCSSQLRLEQDLEVVLGPHLNFLLDQESIQRLQVLITSLQPRTEVVQEFNNKHNSLGIKDDSLNTSGEPPPSPSSRMQVNGLDDIKEIEGIVQEQYREARLRVERNEMRGGLLLPSSTEDGQVSFDAFFDANDQSFSRYSHALSESQITTTTTMNYNGESRRDLVHSKMRCHLNEARAKIVFSSDSYLLLTMSDVQSSSTVSHDSSSNHSLNIAHLEIENAQTSTIPPLQSIRVTSILSFHNHHGGSEDFSSDDVLLQAPCISIAIATKKTNYEQMGMECNHQTTLERKSRKKKILDIEIDVDMEPFVLSCPVSLIENISNFSSAISNKSFPQQNQNQEHITKQHSEMTVQFSTRWNCASLDITLPISFEGEEESFSPLFDRAGIPVSQFVINQSSLGVRFERMRLESSCTKASNQPAMNNMMVSFHQILCYAYLQSRIDGQQHQLLDIISLTNETKAVILRLTQAVDESQQRDKNMPSSSQEQTKEHFAVEAFPSVPAISSFKTFQKDEDLDDGISPLFSHFEEIEFTPRRGYQGPDPQPHMLEEVAKTSILVEFEFPQISCDLTVDEITILAEALANLSPGHQSTDGEQTLEQQQQQQQQQEQDEATENDSELDKFVSVNISFNEIFIAVRGRPIVTNEGYSYILKLGQFRVHMLQNAGRIQHLRILAHEMAFFEAVDHAPCRCSANSTPSDPCLSEERYEAIRRRLRIKPTTELIPIIYKSHLFTPISRHSPSVLVDILDLSGNGDFLQKSIYFTVYDLTHRFDYDSRWIERLQCLISSISPQKNKTEADNASTTVKENNSESLTRLFLCVADSNLDYTSPCRWNTASRLIIRLGELRVSCNLVKPSPNLQAIKLSIGEISICLCNSRHKYSFEDSKLIGKDEIEHLKEVPLVAQTAQDAQMQMNYRTVLMLDFLDALLTVSNGSNASQPLLCVGLSAGEVRLFACKDSFATFLGSIGELCAEACAMNEETYQQLKQFSETGAGQNCDGSTCDDSVPHDQVMEVESKDTLPRIRTEDLQKHSALRPVVASANLANSKASFLLDGYDWTTIDQDDSNAARIPKDDEQSARWYGSSKCGSPSIYRTGSHDDTEMPNENKISPFRIVPHHFPLQPTSDPLSDTDMGAAKYAGTEASPSVKTRVTISRLAVKVRLFDGYDWPECLPEALHTVQRNGSFLLDIDPIKLKSSLEAASPATKKATKHEQDRKSSLMADLLDNGPSPEPSKIFRDILLPDERKARLKSQALIRRLGRRSDKYFQFSATGIQLRNDAMTPSDEHRLSSCLNLKLQDFFVAETISSKQPIKMAGEWFNDTDHPRDTMDGLLTLKMVTWNAKRRVDPDGKLIPDECEAAVRILPLRCFLDQKAIRFVSAFFRSDLQETEDEELIEDSNKEQNKLPEGLYTIPVPLFVRFVAKPLKLKVNYKPQKLDHKALRDGQIVELLNLSPLESLVITLKQVEIENEPGLGNVISTLVPTWIQHVSSTQLIKFLEYSQPIAPFTEIGGGLSDMVFLPLEAIRKGGNFRRAVRAGTASFGRAVAYQTLTMTSSAAEIVASIGGSLSSSSSPLTPAMTVGGTMLPSRPLHIPAGMSDTTSHAVESLSRGFQTANTRIVIIPFREYQRSGTTGLVTSVVRGIPVALTAPASGAAEAISYALVGMRNGLRPDIRQEEEVSQRGLHFDG